MYNITAVKAAFRYVVAFSPSQMAGYPSYTPTQLPISNRYLRSFDSGLIAENCIEVLRESVPENTNFNEVQSLEDFVEECAITTIENVLQKKKLRFETKSVLAITRLMHDQFARFTKTVKANRFVGIKFKTYSDEGLVVNLNKAGFAFDSIQTNFKLYLFHSSKLEPVQVITIASIDINTSFFWQTIQTVILSFYNQSTNIGGFWYLGYYEEDLIGQAYVRSTEIKNTACSSCNDVEAIYYNSYKSFVTFEGFSVAQSDYVKGELWNESLTNYEKDNFGLNFQITVNCDFTDFLIQNRLLFTQAIGLQVAVRFYDDLQVAIRNNNISDRLQAIAPHKLQNSMTYDKGLLKKLEEAINEVDFDTSNIYSKCLPCIQNNQKRGLRYGSI